MNCFYHITAPATSVCVDCKKGLCCSCTSNFTISICPECNLRRARVDKQKIVRPYFYTLAFALVIPATFMYVEPNQFRVVRMETPFLTEILSFFLGFLIFGSAAIVWNLLTPLFRWKLYITIAPLHHILRCFVVLHTLPLYPILVPLKLIFDIRKYLKLKKTEAYTNELYSNNMNYGL